MRSRILDAFARTLAIIQMIAVFIIAMAIIMVAATRWQRYDDTDPPNGRSGMQPLTDNLTGCQYLSNLQGITPRMGADGKQICRKP